MTCSRCCILLPRSITQDAPKYSTSDGHLRCPQLLLSTTELQWTSLYMLPYGPENSLEYIPLIEIAGCCIFASLVFLKSVFLSRISGPVCPPMIMQRHFHFFNLLVSNSLMFPPLIGIKWYLICLHFHLVDYLWIWTSLLMLVTHVHFPFCELHIDSLCAFL